MCIHPEGTPLKKAIAWISEQRKYNSSLNVNIHALIEKACMMFDLTPKDQAFLYKTIVE
jgi:hypothetical protein